MRVFLLAELHLLMLSLFTLTSKKFGCFPSILKKNNTRLKMVQLFSHSVNRTIIKQTPFSWTDIQPITFERLRRYLACQRGQ